MKLLLDTHTFIWLTVSQRKLSEQVKSLLADRQNELFLSLVSVWEMQIKLQLNKLSFNFTLAEVLERQQQTNDLYFLPIELDHIYALASLPLQHRDPFDRLLIAQAVVEQMPLLSIDSVFDAYPIQRLW
ncbi:MAG: type II toxin-antitoxin system VapC family toxin [Moorea sp. SIO4E2]|uniref:type II toxin-antitoxin system VapC family toxin n=1 Tax=Moorena sp. SIO4E2 TaxID=2607826 RepID=UPI0013BCE520|nr:type II toxin-antitoxin system VapC family toxin [Moorena sp. SIO4E2]NEQ07685.1 type II toxin-antitoxin system VapC family toxin [Moorena sp. SIO4E2]